MTNDYIQMAGFEEEGIMPIKPGQRYALNKLLDPFTTGRDERLYVIGKLVGRAIASASDLTVDDWRTIRNAAFPRWYENDWTVCREFRARITGIVEDYRETVLGQMRMF